MAENEYIPRPASSGSTPQPAGQARGATGQLTRMRDMVLEEREVCGKAMEETLSARLERDQYRHVLAASLRGEAIIGERCAKLELDLQQHRSELRDAVANAARLEGSNCELDARIKAMENARSAEVVAARSEASALKAELRAERETHLRELERLTMQHGVAEGRLAELRLKLGLDTPRSFRVRAIGLFLCSGVAFVAAVAFVPPLVRALFGSSTAEEMVLAQGMGGWTMLATEFLLLTLAFGLLMRALSDFRTSKQLRASETGTELLSDNSESPLE